MLYGPRWTGTVTRIGVLYRMSPKRVLLGFPTATIFVTTRAERHIAFEKVEAALGLVRDHAPVRFEQLKRDLACIFVFGERSAKGRYVQTERICDLTLSHIVAPETSPAHIAATIVHEGQHARLFRLGIDRPERERGPIERVCHRAARAFGRRLPDGQAIVRVYTAQMERDPHIYSPEGRLEAQIKSVYGDPFHPLASQFLEWFLRRRYRRALARRSGAAQ